MGGWDHTRAWRRQAWLVVDVLDIEILRGWRQGTRNCVTVSPIEVVGQVDDAIVVDRPALGGGLRAMTKVVPSM